MTTQDLQTINRLADIIAANPGCQLNIDNDCWDITLPDKDEFLARSDDFPCRTDWYSSGNIYGSALSEALLVLLKRTGMKLTAHAV